MNATPEIEAHEKAGSPPPDQFVLRCLVYLAFVGVVTGCLIGVETSAGYWTIFSSLAFGVLASLAHLLEMLTRRLRTRMSELLGLLATYAALLVLIANAMSLLGGAEAQARSPLIIPVAAALLVLLLRETVAVRCAAHFFPFGLSQTITLQRRGVILKDDLVVPPRWVYVVYWLSPVALWMLGTLLLVSHTLSLDFSPLLLIGIVLACVLLVRVLLGVAAWCKAIAVWREAKANGDAAGRRDAAWFVGFNGLVVGGLVLFYVLAVGCNELEKQALLALRRTDDTRILKELEAMCMPNSTGAKSNRIYERANDQFGTSPPSSDITCWSSPVAVLALDKYRELFKPFETDTTWAAAESANGLRSDGLNVRYLEKFAECLVLNERREAEDGKWNVVLSNFTATQEIASHAHSEIHWSSWKRGCSIEDRGLMGLLGSLLWTENYKPDDNILAEAQNRIRKHADGRTNTLIRHARLCCLADALPRDFEFVSVGQSAFDLSWKSIFECQPAKSWLSRTRTLELADEVLRNYQSGFLEIHRYDLLKHVRTYTTIGDNPTIAIEFPDALNNELKAICEYRMADAAIAVARYQRKHQYWPKDLQDCVPEFLPYVPNDPFNPKAPLQFAVNPARIYSQGTATGYHPDRHGQIPFTTRVLMNRTFSDDNLVLYLGSPEFFRKLPDDGVRELPGVDIPGEIKNLTSPKADERRDALRRLAYVGGKAAPGADALVARLADPDKEQRMFAAYILGQIRVKSDAVLSALRAARLDPDADVRFFAKQALRRLDE